MGLIKKSPYFQGLAGHITAPKLALLSFSLFLLLPVALPLEEGIPVKWPNSAQARKEARELYVIYSVVKAEMADLRDSSAWAIAKTILEESTKHSLDPMLVLAVINVESSFQHDAVSMNGARGLMQIRPLVGDALAKEAKLKRWEGEKSLDDPILNIKLGVYYLHLLKKSFRDLKLALTAYNWGPTRLSEELEAMRSEDDSTGSPGSVADSENSKLHEYAQKVLFTYQNYRKSDRQGRKMAYSNG